jgi:hypothetical protein
MRVSEGVGELNIFIGSNFPRKRNDRAARWEEQNAKHLERQKSCPPDGTRTFGPVTFSNDASIYFTRLCDIDAPRKGEGKHRALAPLLGKMSRLSCRIIFDNCPQPLGDFRSAPQFSHLAITAPSARSRGLHTRPAKREYSPGTKRTAPNA